jgi:hypothetical protein
VPNFRPELCPIAAKVTFDPDHFARLSLHAHDSWHQFMAKSRPCNFRDAGELTNLRPILQIIAAARSKSPSDSSPIYSPGIHSAWYYDHDKARWIEEGSAQKLEPVCWEANTSFWNCMMGSIQLERKSLFEHHELPLANATVR